MKKITNYIDNHSWTHWVIAALYFAVILGIYELCK